MNFKELDISHSGNRYALVFQDYLTKWPEVFPVVNRIAKTVATCLVSLVNQHGVLEEIIHDRVPEFLSDSLQDTAGVQQLPTSGGHPQTDGLVKRLVEKQGKSWDEVLDLVLMHITLHHMPLLESHHFFIIW